MYVAMLTQYVGWDLCEVMRSFHTRIEQHEIEYEPITDPSFPHVQLLNLGERIVVNNVGGYLQNRIVFFLMNIHNRDRTIYFARAGEALIEQGTELCGIPDVLIVQRMEEVELLRAWNQFTEGFFAIRSEGKPLNESDFVFRKKAFKY